LEDTPTPPTGGEFAAGVLVTFTGNVASSGGVPDNARFYDSSYNSGTVGTNATFYDNSANNSTVFNNATFRGSSYNNGYVGGDAIFYDTSYNAGNGYVTGNAYFHDNSYNISGTVQGDTHLYDNADLAMSGVSNDVYIHYPHVLVTTQGTTGATYYPGYVVSDTYDSTLNWREWSSWAYGVVPKTDDHIAIVYNSNISLNDSTGQWTIDATSTINVAGVLTLDSDWSGGSINYAPITVESGGYQYFTDSAVNAGTIIVKSGGYQQFNGNSNNSGDITVEAGGTQLMQYAANYGSNTVYGNQTIENMANNGYSNIGSLGLQTFNTVYNYASTDISSGGTQTLNGSYLYIGGTNVSSGGSQYLENNSFNQTVITVQGVQYLDSNSYNVGTIVIQSGGVQNFNSGYNLGTIDVDGGSQYMTGSNRGCIIVENSGYQQTNSDNYGLITAKTGGAAFIGFCTNNGSMVAEDGGVVGLAPAFNNGSVTIQRGGSGNYYYYSGVGNSGSILVESGGSFYINADNNGSLIVESGGTLGAELSGSNNGFIGIYDNADFSFSMSGTSPINFGGTKYTTHTGTATDYPNGAVVDSGGSRAYLGILAGDGTRYSDGILVGGEYHIGGAVWSGDGTGWEESGIVYYTGSGWEYYPAGTYTIGQGYHPTGIVGQGDAGNPLYWMQQGIIAYSDSTTAYASYAAGVFDGEGYHDKGIFILAENGLGGSFYSTGWISGSGEYSAHEPGGGTSEIIIFS
jgi:hypothetical protein